MNAVNLFGSQHESLGYIFAWATVDSLRQTGQEQGIIFPPREAEREAEGGV